MHAVCCARPKELQADVASDARPLLPHLLPPPRGPLAGRLLLLFCLSLSAAKHLVVSPLPWCLFLLCLPRTGISLRCVTRFTWVLQFGTCFVEMCARWKGVLQSTACGLICAPKGASGCGLCQACRHLPPLPFSFPCFCKYRLSFFLAYSVLRAISYCSGWFRKKKMPALLNWMSCALFLMLRDLVTIFLFFFLFFQFSGITLLMIYCYVVVELHWRSLHCNTAPLVVTAACSRHIELNYLVMFVCTNIAFILLLLLCHPLLLLPYDIFYCHCNGMTLFCCSNVQLLSFFCTCFQRAR